MDRILRPTEFVVGRRRLTVGETWPSHSRISRGSRLPPTDSCRNGPHLPPALAETTGAFRGDVSTRPAVNQPLCPNRTGSDGKALLCE